MFRTSLSVSGADIYRNLVKIAYGSMIWTMTVGTCVGVCPECERRKKLLQSKMNIPLPSGELSMWLQ